MDHLAIIKESIKKALNEFELEDYVVTLEHPQLEKYGDYSCNIAMQMGKKLDVNSPREFAGMILEKLKDDVELNKIVEKIEIAGPGFINFYLKKSYILENLKYILSKPEKFGLGESLIGKKIMVEYSHPNPFKAFHIGHLRGTILGDVICRLLESQGAEVIRTNYQGDVGMHIAKCLWAFKKVNPKDYPEKIDQKVDLIGKCYAEGAEAFENSEELKNEIININKKIYSQEDEEINRLWNLGKKWSLEKFHEIFSRLDTKFDREYMESEVIEDSYNHIRAAEKKGILEKSQGAIVFKGDKYGLDTRVFLNSEGLPTYEGKEIGLAYKEFTDFGEIDLCIHNVAVEQISFFKVTFKVEELLDPKLFKGKQYHNAYEFVGLKKGKMSSRLGKVILGNDILDLAKDEIKKVIIEKRDRKNSEEIMEKLGVGAVKYSFLKMSPFKYLAFDIKESININGDSGPYLQYTYARCRSILDKEERQKDINMKDIDPNNEETTILRWVYQLPEVVEKATRDYSPNYICTYLYELAQRFNSFYNKHSVVKAETEDIKQFRLILTKSVETTLKNGLTLLGISTPDKV